MLETPVVVMDVSDKAISNKFSGRTQLWKYLKLRLIQRNTCNYLVIEFFHHGIYFVGDYPIRSSAVVV
jgi:hypothetical protein